MPTGGNGLSEIGENLSIGGRRPNGENGKTMEGSGRPILSGGAYL